MDEALGLVVVKKKASIEGVAKEAHRRVIEEAPKN